VDAKTIICHLVILIGLAIGMAIGMAIGTGMDKKALEEGRQIDLEIKY